MLVWFVLLLVLISSNGQEDTLQIVKEPELDKILREEPIVIALFCTAANAESCEEYESELASIREDFIDMLQGDGYFVKLVDSPLVDSLTPPTEKPVTVMFRQGNPVLYEGPANGEVMMDTFVAYREPGIKELTDTTFEHLTQAASGATTGDWLVLFFTDECEACFKMTAVLDTVACKHRGNAANIANVARLNKQTHGEKTGRRFEVGLDNNPHLIFFRLGKMYRYNLDKYDVASLSSFITSFYKNLPAVPVPPPKTPFDDLVQMCVDYMKEYPVLVGCAVSLPIILTLLFIWLVRGEEEKVRKKKKKKSKENKDK